MAAPLNLREQLMRDEGLSLKPYADSRGKLTIGYGRNLTDVGISGDEAGYLLDNDIADAVASLRAALPWAGDLADVRLAVLENMAFNMGVRALVCFHDMLAAVQARDWQAAAAAMLHSEWAAQVPERAQRLSQQMLRGEWQ